MMKNKIESVLKLVILLTAALALFALGRWTAGGEATPTGPRAQADGVPARPTIWTCPMHAQIQLPEAGDCPICGMDLVALEADMDENPRRLAMSPAAVELARIATQPVERRSVTRSVRMVGKIGLDETLVRTISARVPGRLERLFVDYTGVRVSQGDHMVSLYSPDLLSAQEELLSARGRLLSTAGESSEFLAKSSRRAYETAREKLLLLGLTEEQVSEIEERGTAEDRVMLTSPSSGVVIEKHLEQGAYVEIGTHIYDIAGLDSLWVKLDAYEQDLAWLRYGQEVVIEAEALPGEKIEGRISFIDFVIHEETRTAKVRVNIDNSSGRLKPGMFVRAVAAAHIGEGGQVLGRYLAGKWVCPMHPEVVKDGPEQCDVCGMDLVTAEELGLVSAASVSLELPLVVPSSAVLVTGRRAVVYVEVEGAERPTYEGREVLLGPRAGDAYIVLSGVEEGERVVTHGAFRIDSSMQIRAKVSMMDQPAQDPAPLGPGARVAREALAPTFEAYLGLQRALAADDPVGGGTGLAVLAEALQTVVTLDLDAQVEVRVRGLHDLVRGTENQSDIEELRKAFDQISRELIAIEGLVGNPLDIELFLVHCPMAFDFSGASWWQTEVEVTNPYFGDEMLRCGSVERVSEVD